MKNLTAIFSLLMLAITSFSQTETKDVIYLKNGSIIRGNTISGTAEILKIESEGNNLWVFKTSEIDSVRKEEMIFRKREYRFRQNGFYNISDAGILAGRNSYRNLLSPGFITINGYHFKQGISIGIGIGAEAMEIISCPLFGEIRYDFLKKNAFSPFIALQSGYSFPVQNNYSYYSNHYKGGILFNPEIGIRNYFADGAALVMSIGYRYQELHSSIPFYWQGEEKIGQTETVTYFNRVALRIGFLFH